MTDFKIRKFTHQDTESFIRVATSAFAEEWIADGMTPDGFARQTRQIFRWRMIPYKLFTMLMGIQWEAFVAEVNGHAVGGAMYMGRKNRIVITNLMVDPAYRRQGIGQALLVKRLERLSQRNVPFVIVKALETNAASLGNLRKQGFVEYYRKSAYQCSLPILAEKNEKNEDIVLEREMKPSDRNLFVEIEKKIMSPFVLYNAGTEADYFPSFWQKLYMMYIGSSHWARAFDIDGVTVGFLAADHTHPMTTGYIYQPVIAPENMHYFPTMIRQAGIWKETIGLQSAKIEVPDHLGELASYLMDSGWNKQHTWIYLVKWLDEKVRQEFAFDK
jgi:ribosomal protein S18 acetylase RimI-like enzyme